ncbi:hypothetical protein [Argonema antarcticum]|uniref:hypothetical protein n=1 Tax=Argonema antarcticum TaxID=2942763 RepID=UPI00201173E5|nr:hypothetical protein [Argonema antarcticum]MCL1474610.1 hypothetical protein [Argonema antarcticum A004/B2]
MKKKKLATFRINPDEWQAFQEWAKRSGTNASALLVDYIEQCLDRPPDKISRISPDGTTNNIDYRIDSIDKRLKALEGAIEERIEKLIKRQMTEIQSDLVHPEKKFEL